MVGATFFWIALFAYLAGTAIHAYEIASRSASGPARRGEDGVEEARKSSPGRSAVSEGRAPAPWTRLTATAAVVMGIGFIAETIALVMRGLYVGRIPIDTFFGYVSLLSWLIVLGYLVVLYKYRWAAVGAFVAPVAFVVIVVASLFPMNLDQQLIPALQSYWLQIHVTVAVLGEAAFAVGFATGILYLVKHYEWRASPRGLGTKNALNLLGSLTVGTILGLILFGEQVGGDGAGWGLQFISALGVGTVLAIPLSLIGHRWLVGAGRAANFGGFVFSVTVVSLFVSAVLIGIVNRIVGFVPSENGEVSVFVGAMTLLSIPMYAAVSRIFLKINDRLPKLELLDEVSYKAVAVGWPFFTVGALIAGAIWAHQAWGVYWSWDPKEVGSLVVWLVYALYLHSRAKWGLKANWCAVTAVLGFMAAMLTLVGNFILGGLHAYG
jgi:ABC-type transport system involved in cytochrome c biogenesis permease subunit